MQMENPDYKRKKKADKEKEKREMNGHYTKRHVRQALEQPRKK